MYKFKAGDKVYYPALTKNICILSKLDGQSEKLVVVKEGDDNYIFDEYGCEHLALHRHSSIFHATEENWEPLSKLYGMEFEKPKPTPKQVIECLLQTHKYVACYTSSIHKTPPPDGIKSFITHIHDRSALPFEDADGDVWRYAVPFDIKTGEIITEIEE